MTLPELPSWLRYRTGTRPIVIVAPHGGERAREIRRGDGMNDLYTAELTHELAARLDAYAVVNEGLDRNDVDLNRISAVVDRAPELLRVLSDAVTRAAADDETTTPLVLFVHGWNISSLACDIGIGLRETGGELYGAHATVSWATLQRFVEPLRDALVEQGLEGFVGHRYPASGRDNATQLFSGRHLGHDHADVDRLARLALDGRVDAVQLELSIPLRWPGRYRSRWLAAVEAAVAQYLAAPTPSPARDGKDIRTGIRKWAVPPPLLSTDAHEGASRAPGESVQAVLADGSGLFMGVEPAGPGALAARVCVARPGGELALFVCEAPWSGGDERYAAGGLDWQPGRSVRYAGPAVLYASHEAFVDLEGGLRSARVVDMEIDIALSSRAKKPDQRAGYVRVGEQSVEVSPLVVQRGGGRFAGEQGVRARVMLSSSDGTVVAIEDAGSGPGASGAAAAKLSASGARSGPGNDRDRSSLRGGREDGMRRVPGRIAFADDGARLSAHADAPGTTIEGAVTVRVPVYRPAPDGGFVKVVFGVIEVVAPCDDAVAQSGTGAPGFGKWALFEVVRKIRASG